VDIAADKHDPIASLQSFLEDDDLKVERLMEPLRARYVESDRDDVIRKALKKLHRNACARRNPQLPRSDGNRKPGIGFVVVSESGAGKTTTLERIFGEYPAFQGFGVVGSACPILRIEAPSPCTLKQLAMMILEELGYDIERDLRENLAWKRARKMLKLHGIFFLWIDEVANVLHQASDHEIRKVADTLRGLMLSRRWPVQIILSGVPELEGLLAVDRQLRRRLTYITFPCVSAQNDADLVEQAIHNYAKAAKLNVNIAADDMLIGRLCHAAVHQFGLVMEIIVDAIEACLLDGNDTLLIDDFAHAYSGRTLQPIDQNPFVVPTWETLDCSAIRKKVREALGDAVDAPPRTKPRRRRR